jgi:MoxR-like ATPase
MKKIDIPNPSASELALTSLIAGEHLLIEDIPGTGKTNLAKNLSHISKLRNNRIQCTNDLMPADVIGYNKSTSNKSIEFIKGPIFTNILLVDEMNRAPSRTQSSLLEAMEESQISIEGKTFKLPAPFFVIATQNPRDQVGVFELPESQIDRFSLCINMDILNAEDYLKVLNHEQIHKDILNISYSKLSKNLKAVHFDNKLQIYLLQILDEIEKISAKYLAIRPRVQLQNLAKAYAALKSRNFVVPEDILALLISSMRHRFHEMSKEEIEEMILESLSFVKTP